MLMNLFSVFDPVSYFGASLNWAVMVVGILFSFFVSMYVVGDGVSFVFRNFVSHVRGNLCDISSGYSLGLVYVFVGLFVYLMVSNLIGLFPFIFTSTAHPAVTMGFGVVMWFSFFCMGWGFNFYNSAAHLVPCGSPLLLAPLMVLIESISHLIRPFTLSVRLAANMMAGHLIIGLLSSISMINFFGFGVSLMLQSLMLVLEVGVAVIQGFVFSVLLVLYVLEYY